MCISECLLNTMDFILLPEMCLPQSLHNLLFKMFKFAYIFILFLYKSLFRIHLILFNLFLSFQFINKMLFLFYFGSLHHDLMLKPFFLCPSHIIFRIFRNLFLKFLIFLPYNLSIIFFISFHLLFSEFRHDLNIIPSGQNLLFSSI